MNALSARHNAGALAPVLGWVDARFGPIQELQHTLHRPPEPRWWVYTSTLSRVPFGTPYQPFVNFAAGSSIDGSEALRRALGEAVERYAGLQPPEAGIVFPLRAGESPLLDRFPRCAADEQCPETFRHIAPETVLPHVRVRRLADGAEVPIPAAYVHQILPDDDGPPICHGISTGMSFHLDLPRALWSGLCEAAERDGVLAHWWAGHPSSHILCDRRPLPDALELRLRRLEEAGLRVELLDVSTDFRVPTVLCLLLGREYPYALAGAACAGDALSACTKAIDEAVTIRHYMRMSEPLEGVDTGDFAWVRTLEDHAMLYASWASSPAIESFVTSARRCRSFEEFQRQDWWTQPSTLADLATMARRLENLGLTILWADLTTPEAAELGHVVKVIVPEMVPLSPDHRARWLASPRLRCWVDLHGSDDRVPNPFPHPLA